MSDNFRDVSSITLPQKPIYIQDLIFGLRSDDHNRYKLAIDSIEEIISSQNNNDIENMCSELMQTLFRAQNKFEFPDFMMNKCKGIVSILVNCP